MINEYEVDSYKVRVTILRENASLLSIVLEGDLMGNIVHQVFYGTVANELHKALLLNKMQRSIGINRKLNLNDFFYKGMNWQVSENNH